MTGTEERLRHALGRAAHEVDADEAGSLDRIREKATAVRRRRRQVAVVAMAAVLVPVVAGIAVLSRDGTQPLSSGPAGTGETTVTTAVAPEPTVAEPSEIVDPPSLFVGDAGETPESVAARFVEEWLGFPSASIEPVDSLHFAVHTTNEGGAVGRTVSTVALWQRGDGRFAVLDASADDYIKVDPPPVDVGDSLDVRGTGRTYEGNLVISVRDVDGAVLTQTTATAGCCDEQQPFEATVEVPEGAAAITVVGSTGLESATPEFVVVPINEYAVMTVHVFFSDEDGSLAAIPRVVPRTLGVLRASLEQLLAGPSRAELEAGFDSPFRSNTAGVPFDVTLSDGAVVVDFDAKFLDMIPNVAEAPVTDALLAQLSTTVFQFPSVTSVEYRLGGSCEAFWEGLGGGACKVIPQG